MPKGFGDLEQRNRIAALIWEILRRQPATGPVFDPEVWIDRCVDAVLALLADPSWESTIISRIDARRRELAASPQQIGELLPMTVVAPLTEALQATWTPSRPLVEAVFDQPAARELLQAVLLESLQGFGQRIRELTPEVPRVGQSKLASRFLGAASSVASGIASVVGPELERQIDRHARAFSEEALGRAIDICVNKLTDPKFAETSAAWRADTLASIMAIPSPQLVDAVSELPSQEIGGWLTSFCSAVSQWPEARNLLREELSAIIRAEKPATVEEGIKRFGIDESWVVEKLSELLDVLGHEAELIDVLRETLGPAGSRPMS